MKGLSSSINIETDESVKLSQDDIDYAAQLQERPEIVALLVEIIFAGNQDKYPAS